jgi:hypothetical protein
MRPHHRFIAAAAFLAFAGAAQARPPAAPKTPLNDCVNLSGDYEAFRFGKQYLLIRDHDAHYRLSFSGDCEALGISTQVVISTAGEANRLGPMATRVESRRHSCAVRRVDEIDATQYARYKRISR